MTGLSNKPDFHWLFITLYNSFGIKPKNMMRKYDEKIKIWNN